MNFPFPSFSRSSSSIGSTRSFLGEQTRSWDGYVSCAPRLSGLQTSLSIVASLLSDMVGPRSSSPAQLDSSVSLRPPLSLIVDSDCSSPQLCVLALTQTQPVEAQVETDSQAVASTGSPEPVSMQAACSRYLVWRHLEALCPSPLPPPPPHPCRGHGTIMGLCGLVWCLFGLVYSHRNKALTCKVSGFVSLIFKPNAGLWLV